MKKRCTQNLNHYQIEQKKLLIHTLENSKKSSGNSIDRQNLVSYDPGDSNDDYLF